MENQVVAEEFNFVYKKVNVQEKQEIKLQIRECATAGEEGFYLKLNRKHVYLALL
jgi:hypothetical protein